MNYKRLELKRIQLSQFSGLLDYLDYRAELLGICLVSDAGVTVDEIPLYLALARKLQAAENDIELTDAEHALLVNRMRSHRWRVIVPEILQFYQDVATAPEIDNANK